MISEIDHPATALVEEMGPTHVQHPQCICDVGLSRQLAVYILSFSGVLNGPPSLPLLECVCHACSWMIVAPFKQCVCR